MKRLRCAIYTRKSSEEGLEQDFNSLHAQREACEAYVKSQAGEGWIVVRSRYDDGGISGGTLNRPALQQLLADIRARKIDTVVVYKVDRLTRALADFAKIVEVFDAHGVSFVSVTQQFNTTTSMGRLTLNMLLSFAQFEREVTAERIRDKIAASKRKGLWMGGVVPLGYDVVERKLVVNAAEAETVRTLFRLYLDLGDVTRVQQEAWRRGLRTKARKPNTGKRAGGAPFTRGHLYKLLTNPIYVGEISHKGHRYPGAHEAIVDSETWEPVQAGLERNAVGRRSSINAKVPSLLTGLLYDGEGRPMRPSHAIKAGRRYRYYVSRLPEDAASAAPAAWRIPAPALEKTVLAGLCSFLGDGWRLSEALGLAEQSFGCIRTLRANAARLNRRLRDTGPAAQRDLFIELVARIDIQENRLRISLFAEPLWTRLGEPQAERTSAGNCLRLDIPVRLKRRGVETKLVVADERLGTATPDPNLIAAVTQGHRWFEEIRTGAAPSVNGVVRRHGVDRGDVSRTLPLAFLAPDIVEAILQGRQPVELTAARLKRTRLPLSWVEQRRLLGFTA